MFNKMILCWVCIMTLFVVACDKAHRYASRKVGDIIHKEANGSTEVVTAILKDGTVVSEIAKVRFDPDTFDVDKITKDEMAYLAKILNIDVTLKNGEKAGFYNPPAQNTTIYGVKSDGTVADEDSDPHNYYDVAAIKIHKDLQNNVMNRVYAALSQAQRKKICK